MNKTLKILFLSLMALLLAACGSTQKQEDVILGCYSSERDAAPEIKFHLIDGEVRVSVYKNGEWRLEEDVFKYYDGHKKHPDLGEGLLEKIDAMLDAGDMLFLIKFKDDRVKDVRGHDSFESVINHFHGAGTPYLFSANGAGPVYRQPCIDGKEAPAAASPSLPVAPLKIPMPLDKAGHAVDVTFEVPPLSLGELPRGYFVGLRVLFAPATSEVFNALRDYPVTARIFLYRVDGEKETPIPLYDRKRVSKPHELPDRFEVFELPDGLVAASPYYTEYADAPPGASDASTFVLNFTSAKGNQAPGVYRLKLETTKDIPALAGAKAFLVYEENPRR